MMRPPPGMPPPGMAPPGMPPPGMPPPGFRPGMPPPGMPPPGMPPPGFRWAQPTCALLVSGATNAGKSCPLWLLEVVLLHIIQCPSNCSSPM